MRIIDFEAHFFTEEYVKYLRSRTEPPRFDRVFSEGKEEEGMWLAPGIWAPRSKKRKAREQRQTTRYRAEITGFL